MLDLDGRIEFISPSGLRAMECEDIGSITGRPMSEFFRTEDLPAVQSSIAIARSGQAAHVQGYVRTLNGTPKWWDIVTTPINGSDGRPEKLLSLARDVTELKRAQEPGDKLFQARRSAIPTALAIVARADARPARIV